MKKALFKMEKAVPCLELFLRAIPGVTHCYSGDLFISILYLYFMNVPHNLSNIGLSNFDMLCRFLPPSF